MSESPQSRVVDLMRRQIQVMRLIVASQTMEHSMRFSNVNRYSEVCRQELLDLDQTLARLNEQRDRVLCEEVQSTYSPASLPLGHTLEVLYLEHLGEADRAEYMRLQSEIARWHKKLSGH